MLGQWNRLLTCVVVFAGLVSATPAAQNRGAALRIVVIEGEDAVNIVQQKTATAPVIEVRDRNDQPVAGAVVSFTVRSGRATFNGARALTVTTNAAGRAVATGLTPTGSGALQISASAAFQGQTTAAVTIAQTNVMTVAQTAGAAAGSGAGAGGSGGAGAGSATGGAAGGTGGGLSATTVAIVGGAVAGGTLVAKEVVGGEPPTRFVGTYSGVLPDQVFAITPTNIGCLRNESNSGTIEIAVNVESDGTVSGEAEVNGSRTFTSGSAGCGAVPVGFNQSYGCCDRLTVSGTSNNLQFDDGYTVPGPPNVGTETWRFRFTGTLGSTDITGTFTLSITANLPGQGGALTASVTLQKQ